MLSTDFHLRRCLFKIYIYVDAAYWTRPPVGLKWASPDQYVYQHKATNLSIGLTTPVNGGQLNCT